MDKKYVIGIDSGGTKYLIKACDLSGQVLAVHRGEPVSLYRVDEREAYRRIGQSIDRCLVQFGGERQHCQAIVCGTTGIDSIQDQRQAEALYRSIAGFRCPVLCVNDAEVALYGATGGIGTVLIAGTGSIAFGRDNRGRTGSSGGWPPCIFGDEGSGTWIGYKALQHLSMVMDGRSASSLLSEWLSAELGIRDRKDLLTICQQIERREWAGEQIPVLVGNAHLEGDRYAGAILAEGAELAFRLADAVVNRLELFQEPVFEVAAWGSVAVKNQYFFTQFQNHFTGKYDNARVFITAQDGADGACRIAADILSGKSRWYQVDA